MSISSFSNLQTQKATWKRILKHQCCIGKRRNLMYVTSISEEFMKDAGANAKLFSADERNNYLQVVETPAFIACVVLIDFAISGVLSTAGPYRVSFVCS